MKGFFVTGTDTAVGKTMVSRALIRALAGAGYPVVGMKPVASGCVRRDGVWVNEDALALMAASNVAASYTEVNPYAFEAPVSPHLAAMDAALEVDLDDIAGACAGLARRGIVVVEGVGGVMAPLTDRLAVADLAVRLGLPVILVVGLRLGCLNHALLSAEALLSREISLAGWVANRLDPAMARVEENVATLARMLPMPMLGDMPHILAPGEGGSCGTFDLKALSSWLNCPAPT